MSAFEFSHRQKQIFQGLCFLFLLGLLGLIGVVFANQIKAGQYIGQDWRNKNVISVSAEGKKYVKPDLAVINLAVQTEKKTVDAAMEENVQKMNKIITTLSDLGIAESDLQTMNFQLSPRYEWRDKDIFPPSGKRILVGYDVNQTLRVKVKNLNDMGKVIKEATTAGANQVSNLQLTLANPDKVREEVERQAIKQAQAKAKDLAKALGAHLGKIINVQFDHQMPRPIMSRAVNSAVEGAGTVPQIEVGKNLIRTTVNIIYQIY